MKLVIGCDHNGFRMKEELKPWLADEGHEVIDIGAYTDASSDYPDFSEAAGLAVLDGKAERGILLCGSGVGASIAANKLPGIRAALAHDAFSARQCVYDDDANILCLGPNVIGLSLAKTLITTFLTTEFSGQERHIQRLKKVTALEEKYSR